MDSPALYRSAITAVAMPVPARTGRPKERLGSMTNIGERLMRCVLFLVGLIGLLATDASAVVETVQGRMDC